MANKLVSFVVLNWNGIEDTLLCLDSIKNQTHKEYEIIVVDNGSESVQKEELRKIPNITYVDLPENTGFTGGQIAGFKLAKGGFIALINNDCVLDKNWASVAVRSFTEDNNVAAVGGRAYEWNEINGDEPFSVENAFYSYQVVNPISGHCPTLRTGKSLSKVSSISGSGVMISREAIDKVGYFDEKFFAYYEETDLFARMKRAGYSILYNPDLKTWHKIAQSTKSKPGFYLYHMHRNRFMFAIKNYDTKYALRFFRYYFFNEWTKALFHTIRHVPKADLEKRMLVKAGVWNLLHLPMTLIKRKKIQELGPTYSKLLPNDAQEDVSIIVPCYNYAGYVREALESTASQSVSPTEVIIIDDGSTDDSLIVINKTVKELSHKHPGIDFIILEQENSGIITTKNRGLELARSQWIIFLDSDDILDKDYIKKCTQLQQKDGSDVVYTDMQMFGAIDWPQTVLPYNKMRLRSVNFIHNSSLYRASLLRSIGGYNPKFSIGYEDWELNISLSKITSKFSYLPEPLLLYRRHEGASRDNNAQQKLSIVVKKLEKLHPDLYNINYYWWLEGHRALENIKDLVKFPFRLLKHTYYHSIMAMDRRAHRNSSLKLIMRHLRNLKNKGVAKNDK